ncbi:MAG: NfeD family protein [Desulfobacteraceae bacterium]|jgi:membrane protein implicated in regulation of membrane protease activity
MESESSNLAEIIWFVAGLVMILLEFTQPGLVIVFFGVGAWVVSLLAYLDILETLRSQLLVFGGVSVGLLLALRRWVKDKFYGHVGAKQDLTQNLDEFTGKQVTVLQDVIPGKAGGQVEFKGTSWSAVSDQEVRKGETAVIAEMDGLTLVIKK